MSDQMTAGELGIDQEEFERMPDGVRSTLRKTKQLEREAAEREIREAAQAREIALLRAGIPVDTPVGEMFADGYKGEITPEAIKAKWTELGLGESTPPPPGSPGEPTVEELERQRQLAGVGAGGETGSGPKLEDAINSAQSEEEVMRLVGAAPDAAGIRAPVIQ